ncbi:phosphotransferase-like protein, partial [Nocardia flavorosea]|uniref:phosphotransferase-like protein n=1 Tax=Nocardia flavorosea TaxID=53429 RepID=UPI003CC7C58C
AGRRVGHHRRAPAGGPPAHKPPGGPGGGGLVWCRGGPKVTHRPGAPGGVLRGAGAAGGGSPPPPPPAATAFARGGDDLVIDEMLLTPDLLPIWTDALAGLDVQLVAVTFPLAVAVQRERDRSHPIGLTRGHFHTVHDHGYAYDITVDTTTGTPAALARSILRHQNPAQGGHNTSR